MIQIERGRPEHPQVLRELNREFNEGIAPVEWAVQELAHPGQERVLREPAGFLCGQRKDSFYFSQPVGEVTEMYVRKACRREGMRGVALLTTGTNAPAWAFYESMGYALAGEVHYERKF